MRKEWLLTYIILCVSACSPTLNWREFVPEGSGLRMTFPCSPDRHARRVALTGGGTLNMEMLVCSAGGATYAVSFMNVAQPSQVAATLNELRMTSIRNIQGRQLRVTSLQIQGMTPNVAAQQGVWSGRLPDGSVVQTHVAFFVRGLRVYQAMVMGAKPNPEAVNTFLSGLKFVP
jgi:hypothetical protein